MRMSKFFPTLAFIMLLSVFGVQGQNTLGSGQITTGLSVGSSSAIPTTSQYTQFYVMPTGPAPMTHIIAPQKYDLTGKMPTSLYFSGQNQPISYSQYQTYVTYTGGNSLWIQGATSWSQYAVVPQGAFMSLIAVSPTGGNGDLYEVYPDGSLIKNSYYLYPYNGIGFYANTVGQHLLLFAINDQVSNVIIIDVVGNYPQIYQQASYQQPDNQQPPSYQPPSYGQSGYPSPGGY